MYRSIALACLNANVDPDHTSNDIINLAQAAKFTFELIPLVSPPSSCYPFFGVPPPPSPRLRVLYNTQDVTEAIRTPSVTSFAAKIAKIPEVRNILLLQQRAYGFALLGRQGLVIDGRDIGTRVFPNAECKIFLMADVWVRAKRRAQEIQAAGNTAVDVRKIRQELEERDWEDRTRPVGRLLQATDAIIIDGTEMTWEEQVQRILKVIKQCRKIKEKLL